MGKKESPEGLQSNGKDNSRGTQLQTIFKYLQENTATASMVAVMTGIPQKNICRYKRDLEKLHKLWEVNKMFCKRTGHRAWYLTTDPEKVPNNTPQLNLF